MEAEWGPARAAGGLWSRVMPRVAESLRNDSREISIGMMERIGADLPELIADPGDAETNRASNEANIVLIADLLERGADPRSVELPAPTLAYARVGAHRNTPIFGLLRAYRIGHAYAWQRILGGLRERVTDPRAFAEAVELASTWLHEFIDVVVGLGEQAYTRERERWLRSTSALQAETIKELLDGAPAEPATASLRLGYELERWHLAIVGWLEHGEQLADPIAAIESVLYEVAASLGADRPLIHATGLFNATAWIGARAEPDAAEIVVAAADDELGEGVRIAVGEPGRGVDGFRRSFREAAEARRVAILAGAPGGGLTRYPDVAVAALATADLDQARNFVRTRLGPLAAGDQTSLRLLATLRAYLDEGGSHGRAAHRLGIHENTVRYRVRQAEDLLERPVGPGDLEFRVALALTEAAPGLADED